MRGAHTREVRGGQRGRVTLGRGLALALALATTACASTSNMSDDNDTPRAERQSREQPRVPSGFY